MKMKTAPFLSFSCWNEFFCDCKCGVHRWTKETFTKLTPPIGLLWFTLFLQFKPTIIARQSYPRKTHLLHYPASRTLFSDTITSCRKTAVLL